MFAYRAYLPAAIRNLPAWQHAAGAAVAAIVILIAARHFTAAAPAATAGLSGNSYVQLSSVGNLASQAGPLSVVGEIKSKAEATILAQSSGEIVSLPHSIGDRVGAGAVIGQLENSSQRAALTQAQGAYDSAQAALDKLTNTTSANTSIGSEQAQTAAQNSGSSLAIALRSAYAAFDDAVHAKADTIFVDPRSNLPKLLTFTIPNSQLVINIENERLALNAVFADMKAAADLDATGDVSVRTQRILADAVQIGKFLDDAVTAMNQAVPNNYFSATQIATYQAALAAARTEAVAAASAVTSAKSAYDAAQTGAQTANNTATGGTQSDLASARAVLKSAQGSLDAARANLEKTIIRSPIAGTIVSLPVTRGDYVAGFTQVAVISNPGALYVEAQVTPDDAKTIAVGNGALVDHNYPGIITFVAPALDPLTGKIQVKIGLTGPQTGLTDGETVTVSLDRNKSISSKTKSSVLTIPIVAIKVMPQGPVVFTVSASSTLVANPVLLGTILGDKVVVSGIAPELVIVTDGRGHAAGERVVVATSTIAF
jgi:RND family efflux transporter MFP subunit